MTQLLEDIKAVRELLSVPERWTKGAMTRNAKGERVRRDAWDASCRCLWGAICEVSEDRRWDISAVLERAARLRSSNIVMWNDNPKRTHADVLALLDKAIAAEEGRS